MFFFLTAFYRSVFFTVLYYINFYWILFLIIGNSWCYPRSGGEVSGVGNDSALVSSIVGMII